MNNMLITSVGYARVSLTGNSQEISLQNQIRLLQENNCDYIFYEKASGSKNDRIEFELALEKVKELKSQGYEVSLVCYRLDRLGRNTRKIVEVLEELSGRGISIVSLSENINSSTPTGKMFIQLLAIMSNWELETIRARVKVGVENAKKNGKKIGRPKIDGSVCEKIIFLYQHSGLTVKEIARECAVSERFVYNLLNKINISRKKK